MRGKLEAPMQNDKKCVCVYLCVNAGLYVDRYVCVSANLISMHCEKNMSLQLSLLSVVIAVKDCQCADFSSIASVETMGISVFSGCYDEHCTGTTRRLYIHFSHPIYIYFYL